MAAEAFDPFIHDDDDEDEFARDGSHTIPRQNLGTSHSSPRPQNAQTESGTEDALNEVSAIFPCMELTDCSATDEFGFPSSCFAATFETLQHTSHAISAAHEANSNNITAPNPSCTPIGENLDEIAVVICEEMSVIHKTQTDQSSVKIRGTLQLEKRARAIPGQQLTCDVSLLDPTGHLDGAISINNDFVQSTTSALGADNSFRIIIPETENWFCGPLIEYTCGHKLQPVPMVMST